MFSTLVRGSSAYAVLTLTLSDLQAPQPSGPPVGWSTSAGFPSLLFPSRAVGETLPDEQPGQHPQYLFALKEAHCPPCVQPVLQVARHRSGLLVVNFLDLQ